MVRSSAQEGERGMQNADNLMTRIKSSCVLVATLKVALGVPFCIFHSPPPSNPFILSAKPLGLTFKMHPGSEPPLRLLTWSSRTLTPTLLLIHSAMATLASFLLLNHVVSLHLLFPLSFTLFLTPALPLDLRHHFFREVPPLAPSKVAPLLPPGTFYRTVLFGCH